MRPDKPRYCFNYFHLSSMALLRGNSRKSRNLLREFEVQTYVAIVADRQTC